MSIQVPPDSTGKTVETNAPNGTDQRQVVTVGDASTGAGVAKVQNADPGSTDYGMTVRNVRGTASNPDRVDPTGTTVQPVSATALPLPTGAATAAKQPALGTAGSASADVISVQGIASMTALKVDGSGVTQPVSGTFFQTTQPVSGTVTANAGTGNFTVQQATASNLNAAVTQATSPWVVQQSATLPVTLITVGITASSSGDNTVIASLSAKKIFVVAWNLSFSGTVNAKFTDGAAGTLLAGLYYGVANAGAGNSIAPPYYLWAGSTTTALILNLSGATAVGGSVTYFAV